MERVVDAVFVLQVVVLAGVLAARLPPVATAVVGGWLAFTAGLAWSGALTSSDDARVRSRNPRSSQLDDKHRETANALAKKQGPEFDSEYLKAMIEGHQDLAAKLESRLDVQSLAEWKTAAAGRTERNALPDPKSAMADVQVRPNKSDNTITSRINQWAADTYPVVQKHLDNARALENATKKGSPR